MSNQNSLHPGQACLECRRRKTRCDGVRPTCSRCQRLRKDCVFEPEARRPQLDRMEERLLELEGIIGELARRPVSLNHELIRRLMRDDVPSTDRTPAHRQVSSGGVVTGSEMSEGYGSVVPRALLDAGLQRVTEVVPLELADDLTRLLLPFRGQFHFYVHIPRFLHKIRLQPSDAQAVHPALLNAVFLAACNVGGGFMATYETLFLNRTRHFLQQSLAMADRLVDFMWANVLLVSYYIRVGRVVEAHNALASTVRFAVGAGLHDASEGQTGLAMPPADSTDRMERTHLWYALMLCEAAIGVGAGLPPSAPREHCASLEALFFGRQIPSGAVEIKTKAAVLLHEIKNLIAIPIGPNGRPLSDFSQRYNTLIAAHSTLRSELPSLVDPCGLQPTEAVSYANPDLVQAHLSFHVCTILLFNIQTSGSQSAAASEQVTHAAHSMANIALHVRRGVVLMPIQAHLTSVWYYHTACEVLIREIKRLTTGGSPGPEGAVEQTDRSLAALFDTLLDLVDLYPRWQSTIRKLPQLFESDEYDTI
ncbi:uncharacterized protein EI90DRAFT_3081670 [Cantharellus anzutake]|uniref:uncharacterized protein n=1 Tax=Cantharellus anzutake TaxID=1750568 RepID=UPI00190308EA|nr:uncharacterized protein EI90DRAFT_3081670 [Cantharellus anzutake]KAF8319857.1 hypothetical protein EI90DRAFT_3081670 [Cantharellus anzutake]